MAVLFKKAIPMPFEKLRNGHVLKNVVVKLHFATPLRLHFVGVVCEIVFWLCFDEFAVGQLHFLI